MSDALQKRVQGIAEELTFFFMLRCCADMAEAVRRLAIAARRARASGTESKGADACDDEGWSAAVRRS